MTAAELQSGVQMLATIVGITGGLIGLFKFFSEKRDKELREWQKVAVFKILQQNEMKALGFQEILEKYRSESLAFEDVNLKKKELGADALRRILLELASSHILRLEPSDKYRLILVIEKQSDIEKIDLINKELSRIVSPNPFVFTLDEVLKEIAPKVGIEIPLLRNTLRLSIDAGLFTLDESGRIAFAR